MTILFNILVLFIQKLLLKWSTEGKWKGLIKFFRWNLEKLMNILTFGWYIRYILEMNQYILISSISEIYAFDISKQTRIVSLIFAIWVLSVWASLIIIITFLSFSSYELSKDKHNKIGEFFCGIKMQKKNKLFITVLLMRRAIFVALLITVISTQSWILIEILSLIQFCYLIYLILLRPFIETKGNIIEIMNEVYFIFLLNSLSHLDSKENWTSTNSNIYIWVIVSNNIWIFIIVFSK